MATVQKSSNYGFPAECGKNFVVKDIINFEQKRGLVYQISCRHCNAVYVGETGRRVRARKLEYVDAVKTFNTKKSALSQHVMNFERRIDWDNVKILKSESVLGHLPPVTSIRSYPPGHSNPNPNPYSYYYPNPNSNPNSNPTLTQETGSQCPGGNCPDTVRVTCVQASRCGKFFDKLKSSFTKCNSS